MSPSVSTCNHSQDETRQFGVSSYGSESESNWTDECAMSEGSSFEETTLSFRKLHNSPSPGPSAKAHSILSNGISGTQLSDDARPLQDWETHQRMLEKELDDALLEALEHEKNLAPQAALSAAEAIRKQCSKENISRGTEKSHDRARSELQSQDCGDWVEIFEFCVW